MSRLLVSRCVRCVCALVVVSCSSLAAGQPASKQSERSLSEPIDIGSGLELMVDDHLIAELKGGAALKLHHPVAREVSLTHDQPWEGNASCYHTVFRDGDLYRMYYRGSHLILGENTLRIAHQVVCYAESKDGIHWTKPDLGLVEFEGSKKNNILIGNGPAVHNFAPFLDANPACKPDERYKALGGGGGGLMVYKSADGIHWSVMHDKPVITEGAFDSQNLAFWDPIREEYREYHRAFRDGRDIMTTTSADFVQWTKPVFLEYTPARLTELYTNQINPYHRAPHLFLGLPARYIAGRGLLSLLNETIARSCQRCGSDYTDTGFIASRDATRFHVWGEAFIRPGPETGTNWAYGNKYTACGIVETPSNIPGASNELSLYSSDDGYWRDHVILRRYALRIDGFASVAAGMSGGELLSRPLVFAGSQLTINFATSAAGSVRVEIQDAAGNAMDGFALADSADLFGDCISRQVSWKGGADVSKLAGKPIRLRVVLKDADLYSLQFMP